jgi:hypothetical protein
MRLPRILSLEVIESLWALHKTDYHCNNNTQNRVQIGEKTVNRMPQKPPESRARAVYEYPTPENAFHALVFAETFLNVKRSPDAGLFALGAAVVVIQTAPQEGPHVLSQPAIYTVCGHQRLNF